MFSSLVRTCSLKSALLPRGVLKQSVPRGYATLEQLRDVAGKLQDSDDAKFWSEYLATKGKEFDQEDIQYVAESLGPQTNAVQEKGLLAMQENYENLVNVQLLDSRAYLECVAQICSTEFSFPTLKADALKQTYKKQLAQFEDMRIDDLRREAVPEKAISALHHLYQMRARTSVTEIADNIRFIGFLKNNKNWRVVETESTHPRWMITKFLNPTNTAHLFRALAWEDKVYESNQQLAQKNVRRIRGMIGLIRAAKKGLTLEQRKTLLTHLNPLTPEIKQKIDNAVQKLAELAKTKDHKAADTYLKTFLKDLPAGPAGDYFAFRYVNATTPATAPVHEELEEEAKFLNSPPDPKVDIEALKAHIQQVVQTGLEGEEKQDAVKATIFNWVLEDIGSQSVQDDLTLLDNIGINELTNDQEVALLDIFAQESADLDDSLLNDVMNPHPLAFRLWFERASWVNDRRYAYTKQFEESFEHFNSADDPKGQALFQKNPKGMFDSPVAQHPPWNTALEEVYHAKLIRLAEELYGFELDTELGMAQFYSFLHYYDVSPGEETLDRCHTYPPPHHTYEELPLIKFDGWENDFEGIQLSDYEREERIPQLRQEINDEIQNLLGGQKEEM